MDYDVDELLSEAEKEWRRMKREGEVEEAKQKAKEMAKEKAAETARNVWRDTKQSVKRGIRRKAEEAQKFGERSGRKIAGRKASSEDQGPEPVVKIEKDGITIYEYGEVSGNLEEDYEA
ncbi:MAG: hypothetical protein ABEJ87_02290 [Candidatus Nanohalobium sp.]